MRERTGECGRREALRITLTSHDREKRKASDAVERLLRKDEREGEAVLSALPQVVPSTRRPKKHFAHPEWMGEAQVQPSSILEKNVGYKDNNADQRCTINHKKDKNKLLCSQPSIFNRDYGSSSEPPAPGSTSPHPTREESSRH